MQNLVNNFILTGYLSEMRIEFKNNAIKAKFSLDYKNYSIQCNFYISKLYSLSEYNNFINILTQFSPKLDTPIYFNEEVYYTVFSKEKQSKLFISGNITEIDDRLFFNGKHIAFTNSVENLDINIECVTVDKNKLLNICQGEARIFNIEHNFEIGNKIIKLNLDYLFPYLVENNVVKMLNLIYKFKINSFQETEKCLKNSEIKQALLEYDIMKLNRSKNG